MQRYATIEELMYLGVLPSSRELYHHGIKGQQWGKRNGDHYPLKPEQHSAAEKKAGYKSSLNISGRAAMKNPNRSFSQMHSDATASKAARLDRKKKAKENNSTLLSEKNYKASHGGTAGGGGGSSKGDSEKSKVNEELRKKFQEHLSKWQDTSKKGKGSSGGKSGSGKGSKGSSKDSSKDKKKDKKKTTEELTSTMGEPSVVAIKSVNKAALEAKIKDIINDPMTSSVLYEINKMFSSGNIDEEIIELDKKEGSASSYDISSPDRERLVKMAKEIADKLGAKK